MYKKIIPLIISGIFISAAGFSQDTTDLQIKKDSVSHQYPGNKKPLVTFRNQNKGARSGTKPIYRDTRLGSSSKMYDTYKKNDYGAGAITTNPNK